MSGSITPNYGFALPTIGGDQDAWGNKLNGNWSSLDTLIHNLVVAAGGSSATSLPLTGGTLTGPLAINSTLTVAGTSNLSNASVNGALNVSGTANIGGNCAARSLEVGAPTVTDFDIYVSGSQRVLQYSSGATAVYDTSTGAYYWNVGTPIMHVDNGGNLFINGTGFKPGGGPWAASSDDRMKRNVAPYTAGLDAVCQLSPIAFQYNGQGDTDADGKTYYGLSAQKTQAVMPELVVQMGNTGAHTKRLSGQLGTQLGPLLLAACNAIRELRDRVVALEARSA